MNSFGILFRLTSFGESHGPAIGGTIDGFPAGLAIDCHLIERDLARRRLGDTPSDAITSRREPDTIEWLSGIFEGITTGTPITFIIRNSDARSADYESLRDCCRPGHADYTYQQKYSHRDHRGGGRASGRETAVRVVAGAIAKQILSRRGVSIQAVNDGFEIHCTILGVPAGIGQPIFNRLNASLAFAMLSIPSAMAFAMGDTPESFRHPQFPDQWNEHGQGSTLAATNHCGGIQGGISNGMPILFHVAFHPPVTRTDGMICRRADGTLASVAHPGRHDSSHATRLPVIVEAMAAITLLDAWMQHTPNIDNN